LEEENKRILLQFAAESAATAANVVELATINAVAEIAATINNLHEETKHMRLLLAAERDATAAARAAADEAAATISKLEAIIAKSVNAAGTMASSSLVPAFANEPSRKVHIRSQPGAREAGGWLQASRTFFPANPRGLAGFC
jgi:hypothetical protein